MVRLFRKLARLTTAEWGLLAEAWAQAAAVRLALWTLPFRIVSRIPWEKTPAGSRVAAPERVAWAVVVAARYVPRATCLVQALAGQALLARRGCSSRLHIGVAKPQGRFEAHAWLEWEGQVLLGASGMDGYTGLLTVESEIATRP